MDIESRLKRLEWTNRILSILLLALAGNAAIRHVNAQGRAEKIVADSVETRSITVDNPSYGKQGLKITVGDDGIVTLLITDVNGKETIGLGSVDPVGEPSICLAYEGVCRVVLGDVNRGNQREFSVQLRDKDGHPVWMPETANIFTPSPNK